MLVLVVTTNGVQFTNENLVQVSAECPECGGMSATDIE
jgi:hypothetical protein